MERERTIQFPGKHSLGIVKARELGKTKVGDWHVIGKGEGTLKVPAGREVALIVPTAEDAPLTLDPILALGPYDIQVLDL
ncbi:hypothetical protein HYR69_05250, partial [Candidatus Sumerlaeota bacterium]|nr:hypothetical protein [Candidatus Sumerlaeota bacterium]